MEEAEIKIFKEFQPEQFSEEEIMVLADEAISKTGASSKKDIGKVMGILIPKLKGKAEGSLVSRIVTSKLE